MAAIVLFCAALLVCVVLKVNILYALAAGLVIFTLYGKKQGFSWRELGEMIVSGVKTSTSVLLVFPLIGMLTAFWRACGALPLIICCAVDLIRPEILVLMTFLLNCGVSVLTGTAFGTAATMGTICVSVGVSMGMDPVLLGGARADLWPLYGREMTLTWVMCLPAVLIFVLSLLHVKVKRAMVASILASVLLCIFVRHLDALTLLKTAVFGYTAADAEVGAMLNGGGMLSMLRLMLIITISSAYSGIFRRTGLLDGLCGRIASLSEKTSPYCATLVTATLASLVACNQTLTIILTHQLCAQTQQDARELALDLENTAVVIAPLVPWSIAGATPLSTVGAPMAAMALACFLYLLPLCELVRRTAEQRRTAKTKK